MTKVTSVKKECVVYEPEEKKDDKQDIVVVEEAIDDGCKKESLVIGGKCVSTPLDAQDEGLKYGARKKVKVMGFILGSKKKNYMSGFCFKETKKEKIINVLICYFFCKNNYSINSFNFS